MMIFERGVDSAIVRRPWPTSLLPSHCVAAPLPLAGPAVGFLHARVFFLVRRPRDPTAKAVNERKNFFRWRLDARRALNTENIGPCRGVTEKKHDGGDDHDSDYPEHRILRYDYA